MEEQSLVTLLLGGGGLGAVWALARWYLKERLQRELDRQTWQQEVQKRRDELRMAKLDYEQTAMREVFARFGELSDRMSELILELALPQDAGGEPRPSERATHAASSKQAAATPQPYAQPAAGRASRRQP
ncbi:hypothetical protein [Haliangium ochraceum]|uniref:Uncharacterized protein n=1 Tax=Haliangium ochraceum (strain DSM 14365 / JCM 11303 / SMP-2) TaxID=502025 RepID=D0LWT2_HALO1|nr:hypothetical protein [Haliangium ochraceum]ACY14179.1 hypothetical protein Hoch_1629 [Haliangium ochraceum DSM 14365]